MKSRSADPSGSPGGRPSRVVRAVLLAVLGGVWPALAAAAPARAVGSPARPAAVPGTSTIPASAPTGPVSAEGAAAGDTIVVLPVHGSIGLGLVPLVNRVLGQAASSKAAGVLLEVDAPGGRLDAAWDVAAAIRSADVPVWAYVEGRALGPAALVALSARKLFVGPAAVVGDLAPRAGSGGRAADAVRAELRSLAEAHGYQPSATLPGHRALTATEAVAAGVAAAPADGLPAVLAAIGHPGAPTRTAAPGWFDRAVTFLAAPLLAPILLALGFLGLLVEIKHPTLGAAAGLGVVSLVLFFGSRYLVELAGTTDLLLVGTGVVLIGLEVFVVPGLGVPGVLGLGALLAGTFLSLLGHFPTGQDMLRASGLVATAALLVLALAYAVVRHIPHSRALGMLGSGGDGGRAAGILASTRREDLVGVRGEAVTDLRPSGTAVFRGERLDVVSEGAWIESGTPVVVVRSDGYRHVVRAGDSEEPTQTDGPAEAERPGSTEGPGPAGRSAP